MNEAAAPVLAEAHEMDYLTEVAEFAAGFNARDLPRQVIARTKLIVADCVGAIADREPSTVDPDQHGSTRVGQRATPHVEIQTVLGDLVDPGVVEGPDPGRKRCLDAGGCRDRRAGPRDTRS